MESVPCRAITGSTRLQQRKIKSSCHQIQRIAASLQFVASFLTPISCNTSIHTFYYGIHQVKSTYHPHISLPVRSLWRQCHDNAKEKRQTTGFLLLISARVPHFHSAVLWGWVWCLETLMMSNIHGAISESVDALTRGHTPNQRQWSSFCNRKQDLLHSTN